MGWITRIRALAKFPFYISNTRVDNAASGWWLTLNAADVKDLKMASRGCSYDALLWHNLRRRACCGSTYDGGVILIK